MSLKYRTGQGTSASDFSDLVVKVGDTLPIGSEIDYDGQTAPAGWQEVSETKLGDVVADSIKTKNLFNKYVGTDGYLTSSGSVISNPDHRVSDYIDIDGISNITISGSQGSGLENCFYNSSKAVIGHFSLSSASTTQEVPSGTKYIRLTVKKTALDTYQLEAGSTATNYTSYFNSNNIGQTSDYVKLVVVNKGSSLTLDGDASTEISSSVGIPTIQGYKLIGCIGGAGVGNTGLLVSSSVGSPINMWVHNTKGTQQTWSDVEIDLLYIRDL